MELHRQHWVLVPLEEKACLESAVRERLRARHNIHGWRSTSHGSPKCRRHPEECEQSQSLCRTNKNAFFRSKRSLNGKGERLRRPACIDSASGSVVLGFLDWCSLSASFRSGGDSCSNIMLFREPVKRLVLEYRRACLSVAPPVLQPRVQDSRGALRPCADAGFAAWARSRDNYYTRLLASIHSGAHEGRDDGVLFPQFAGNVTKHELRRAQAHVAGVAALLVDRTPSGGNQGDPEVPLLTWSLLAGLLRDSTGLLDAPPGGVDVAHCTREKLQSGVKSDDGKQRLFVPTAADVREVQKSNKFDMQLYDGLLGASVAPSSLNQPRLRNSDAFSDAELPGGAQPNDIAHEWVIARGDLPDEAADGRLRRNSNLSESGDFKMLPVGHQGGATVLPNRATPGARWPVFRIILFSAVAIVVAISVLQSCVINGTTMLRCCVLVISRLIRRCRTQVRTYRRPVSLCYAKCSSRGYACYRKKQRDGTPLRAENLCERGIFKQRRASSPETADKTLTEPLLDRNRLVSAHAERKKTSRRGASAAKAEAFFTSQRRATGGSETNRTTIGSKDDDDEDSGSGDLVVQPKDTGFRGDSRAHFGDGVPNELSAFLTRADLSQHESWLRAAGFAEVLDLSEANIEDFTAAQRDFEHEVSSRSKMTASFKAGGQFLSTTEIRRLRRALAKEATLEQRCALTEPPTHPTKSKEPASPAELNSTIGAQYVMKSKLQSTAAQAARIQVTSEKRDANEKTPPSERYRTLLSKPAAGPRTGSLGHLPGANPTRCMSAQSQRREEDQISAVASPTRLAVATTLDEVTELARKVEHRGADLISQGGRQRLLVVPHHLAEYDDDKDLVLIRARELLSDYKPE
jgi:hypothetical protein